MENLCYIFIPLHWTLSIVLAIFIVLATWWYLLIRTFVRAEIAYMWSLIASITQPQEGIRTQKKPHERTRDPWDSWVSDEEK